jgi:hypothetical protein
VDFGVLVFVIVAAVIARAVIKAVNWANTSDTTSGSRATARRRQLQQMAERMRSATGQSRPGFPQPPRAPVAPPRLPFTGQWPPPAPPTDAPPPPIEPDAVVVAVDQEPDSAYSTAEPADAALSPDVTDSAPVPPRRPYELSSSLDTTLSTSLTSSVIGEPGSVANGPETVDLPPDLQQQVLDLMDRGYEVMAVRLVCDEMDVGILDAHKTVRTVAGLPTLI